MFTEKVDMVSGVGWDRGAHEIRAGGDQPRRARLRHPGPARCGSARCTPASASKTCVAATGFELVVPDEVPRTRLPDAEELRIMREVLDPKGLREREVRS